MVQKLRENQFSQENLRGILENQQLLWEAGSAVSQWQRCLVTSALKGVISQYPNPLVPVDFFLTFLLTAMLSILLPNAHRTGACCLCVIITLLTTVDCSFLIELEDVPWFLSASLQRIVSTFCELLPYVHPTAYRPHHLFQVTLLHIAKKILVVCFRDSDLNSINYCCSKSPYLFYIELTIFIACFCSALLVVLMWLL